MPILKTSAGWQVVDNDGKPMSKEDLTRAEAEKQEKELAERHPLRLWIREHGLLRKP